jgi:hypothetical protein
VVTDADADDLWEGFALTNKSLAGTMAGLVEVAAVSDTFTIGLIGDEPEDATNDVFIVTQAKVTAGTQVLTVGGAAATFTQFQTASSNGDTVTYSRTGGIETFALVNAAPVEQAGVLTNDPAWDAVLDTLTLVNGANDVAIDYSALGAGDFFVDGVSVTEAEFEAALTIGDAITHRGADTGTSTDGYIKLVSTAATGRVDDVDTAANTLDILNTNGNVIAQDHDYTAETSPRYFVNGTERNITDFESFLTKVDADATPDDTLKVTFGTLSTNYELTTDETIP